MLIKEFPQFVTEAKVVDTRILVKLSKVPVKLD